MGHIKILNGNFHGMCMFLFHGYLHQDEYKPKGLELVEKANGTHIFLSDVPVGKFGLPLKTFRLFRKFPGRANQNSLSIYIPTEISGLFWQMVNTHGLYRGSAIPLFITQSCENIDTKNKNISFT